MRVAMVSLHTNGNLTKTPGLQTKALKKLSLLPVASLPWVAALASIPSSEPGHRQGGLDQSPCKVAWTGLCSDSLCHPF